MLLEPSPVAFLRPRTLVGFQSPSHVVRFEKGEMDGVSRLDPRKSSSIRSLSNPKDVPWNRNLEPGLFRIGKDREEREAQGQPDHIRKKKNTRSRRHVRHERVRQRRMEGENEEAGVLQKQEEERLGDQDHLRRTGQARGSPEETSALPPKGYQEPKP